MTPEEDWSLDTEELKDKVFAHPSTLEPPYDVFPDDWAHEPFMIKGLVQRAIMREYWKKRRSNKQARLPGSTISIDNSLPICSTGWASCFHVTAGENPTPANANRFAALQQDEQGPRGEDVRQELRRLRDQVAQLGRRMRDQDVPESSSTQSRDQTDRRSISHCPQHER